jgi:hypothetical protein
LCNIEQPGFLLRGIIHAVNGGPQLMPLLTVLLALIVVGVLLWLVNTYIPMAGSIKSILNAVVVIVVVVWLLNAFGVLSVIQTIRIGRS